MTEINWRVQDEQIVFLTNDKPRATRPASPQEIDLWRLHKGQVQKLADAEADYKKLEQGVAQMHADNRSLIAANEAYREQLDRLAKFIVEKFPAMTDELFSDAVAAAIELLGNYRIIRDAYAVPPAGGGLLVGPGTDAYALPGSVGVNPTAGLRIGEAVVETPVRKRPKKEKS